MGHGCPTVEFTGGYAYALDPNDVSKAPFWSANVGPITHFGTVVATGWKSFPPCIKSGAPGEYLAVYGLFNQPTLAPTTPPTTPTAAPQTSAPTTAPQTSAPNTAPQAPVATCPASPPLQATGVSASSQCNPSVNPTFNSK